MPLSIVIKNEAAHQTIKSPDIWMRYGSMKETQMPPARAANLAENSDNTAYVVESISVMHNPWWRNQIETFFRVTGLLRVKFTGHLQF